MAFYNSALRLTQQEAEANGVIGMPDIPALSTAGMQRRIDGLATFLGREKYNALLAALADGVNGVPTVREMNEAIAGAAFAAGSGDMQRLVYDPDGRSTDLYAFAEALVSKTETALDEIVSGIRPVASGIGEYTHGARQIDPGVYHHILTGTGQNIRATFTEDWHENDTIEVNGAICDATGSDGEPLAGGAIKAGGTVLALRTGDRLTFGTGGRGERRKAAPALTALWEGKAVEGQVIPVTGAGRYPFLIADLDRGTAIIRPAATMWRGSAVYANHSSGGHTTVFMELVEGTGGMTVRQMNYTVHTPSGQHSAQIAFANGIRGIYAMTIEEETV